MCKTYNVIVPANERCGPTNLALDLAALISSSGYRVNFFYLSEGTRPVDSPVDFTIQKLRLTHLMSLDGIIHTHGLRAEVIGFLIKIFRPRNRLVCTVHNHFIEDLTFIHRKLIVYAAFYIWKLCVSRYDRIIYISRDMKSYYRPFNLNKSSEVIYNFRWCTPFVKTTDYRTSVWSKAQKDKGKHVLLYCGALIPRKNILNLMSYVSGLDSCSLLICGDGVQRKEVKKMALASDNIEYIGFKDNISEYISLADFLILPSYAEGFPLTVIEGAHYGNYSSIGYTGTQRNWRTRDC